MGQREGEFNVVKNSSNVFLQQNGTGTPFTQNALSEKPEWKVKVDSIIPGASNSIDTAIKLPLFQTPKSYGRTFPIFFLASFTAAVFFPVFSLRAIYRIRENKFGLTEDGQIAKLLSLEGMYVFALNMLNNTLYLGILLTLCSAFVCKYDENRKSFFMVRDEEVKCYSLESEYIFYVVGSIVALLLYFPLSTILVPGFQFLKHGLQIKFKQAFVVLERVADLHLAMFSVFYKEWTSLVLINQMLVCIILAIYNDMYDPCLIPFLNFYKTIIYIVVSMISCIIFISTVSENIVLVVIAWSIFGFITALGIHFVYSCKRKRKREKNVRILPSSEQVEQISNRDLESGITNDIVPSSSKEVKNNKFPLTVNIPDGDILCPTCRVSSKTSVWVRTFVSLTCPVCLQDKYMCISNVCGHPICLSCLQTISKKKL